jgi:RluA family pseudouridine synthase
VDGRIETFGSRRLRRGEVVDLILPEEPLEHVFEARRVLLDDGAVLAYDKPPFLPVTPTDGVKSWSLLDILRRRPGAGLVVAVHRLDADTSGIVLFARQEAAARRLEEGFAGHAIEKTYLALVRGHPPERGERRSYLVKAEARPGFERWRSGRGADAREAVTAWRVVRRLGPWASLVEVVPATGRHHQIRLHFAEMGHPLYGDRLYGDRRDPVHVHRQMLHASAVRFPHPLGGEAVALRCPPPRDFAEAARRLG